MAMAGLSTTASAVVGRNCVAWQLPCAARATSARILSVGERHLVFTDVRISSGSSKPCVKSLNRRIECQASEKDTVAKARKYQMEATELLAELLKSNDVKATAEKHVESLSQDFFIIASTYLDMAKKEGNLEVVSKLETTLQTALTVKEATLRPEIRLLNQLLRDTAEKDRANTIQANLQCLAPDSYFFQLLSRMIIDVESQKSNPNRLRLLTQLRMISKETKEVAKAMRRKEEK